MKTSKPYDSKLIGIISTNPGVLMGSIDSSTGSEQADKRMLALSGRVPVKIDPNSPPIEVGDFLTSSDKPGLAKKPPKQDILWGRRWRVGILRQAQDLRLLKSLSILDIMILI